MAKLMSSTEALYQTMHNNYEAYQKVNQGLTFLTSFFHLSCFEPGNRIIEFGCGNGGLCKVLSRGDLDVTGIDVTSASYTHDGFKFIKHDLVEPLTFLGDNSADACISFDVLEHLKESDAMNMLTEMVRIGKCVVFSVASHGEPPLHLTIESPGWWLDKVIEDFPQCEWQVLKVVERRPDIKEGQYATVFYGRKTKQ